MQMNRRDFLKVSIPVTGLSVLGGVLIPKIARAEGSTTSLQNKTGKALLYDSSKCIGCRACEAACRKSNKLPVEAKPEELSARSWTVVKSFELETENDVEKVFLKRQCMHCAKASCVAVCPAGAAAYNGEFVTINQEKCTGCGYCVEACPFDVPHRDESGGTAKKCTFCIDRVKQGLKTACTAACPVGAVQMGNREELVAQGKDRVQALFDSGIKEANLYGESVLGGLGVLYVLVKPPLFYQLPEVPRQATENVFTQWLSGIATAGLLMAVPFGLLFGRKQEVEKKQKSKVTGEVK
jgi:formate dehydrogenase iron-sulfur subunit